MAKVTALEQLGGEAVVRQVHELFYEDVFEDPWLKHYFVDVPRDHIIEQQTAFMVAALGGPNRFAGRHPRNAHPHLFITDELFDHRARLLEDAIERAGVPEQPKATWLRIDEAFRSRIVKRSIADCKGRHVGEEIIAVACPWGRKKAA